MLEEKEKSTLTDEETEVGAESWQGDFCIDIDIGEIEIEFEGQTPRLTGRIEINLKAPGEALLPGAG